MYNDFVLNQDPLNFNDEIEYRIFNGQLTIQDLIDLFKDDYIDLETLTNGIEYAQYLEDGLKDYNSKVLTLETKKLLHQAKQNKAITNKMLDELNYYNIRRT